MANSYNLNDAYVIIMAHTIGGILSNPSINPTVLTISDLVTKAARIAKAGTYEASLVVGDMSTAQPPASNFLPEFTTSQPTATQPASIPEAVFVPPSTVSKSGE